MKSVLRENRQLDVYKALVSVLGEYSDRFPATAADKLFDEAVSNGKKIVPKETRALRILSAILANVTSIPARVQELLNIRFTDLAVDVRPMYRETDKTYVAFWNRDGNVYDKVIDLVGFDGKSSGHWSDASGKKVKIISL